MVHPNKIWKNTGARPGDVLILTKPIGSGVIFNANLKGWVSERALGKCLETISTLNKTACEVLQNFDVHASTDVTGFGLAGHALEIAEGSGVALEINIDDVPIMDEALEMYQRGMTTGVNSANRALVKNALHFDRELARWHEEIFIDPQTSGGLLVAIAKEQADEILARLHEAGVDQAKKIGIVAEADSEKLLVFN